LDAIEYNKIDCAIGGGRRDEEKARAKERSFRTEMTLDSGTLKTRDLNFGIFSMANISKVNILEHFQLVIGLKWTFGII
jgi:3'-phosphoadenosine 5'-phosphosulfate sulfotransferase (PAPS reductase)/FAD synthetase